MEPDVKVSADQALDEAKKMAAEQIHKKFQASGTGNRKAAVTTLRR